eukprot:g11652.t1
MMGMPMRPQMHIEVPAQISGGLKSAFDMAREAASSPAGAELQNDAQKLAEKAKTAFEHQDTHELKEGATEFVKNLQHLWDKNTNEDRQQDLQSTGLKIAKMASDQVEKSVPQAKGLLKAALQQQGGSDLAQKAELAYDQLKKAGLEKKAEELAEKAEKKLAMEFKNSHNLTTLATELRLLGGNAFSQEYGALPSRELLARGAARRSMRRWVFVTNIRDPWSRFWSQLRHEMAPCLSTVQALAVCVAGQHQRLGPWWSPTSHIDSVLGVSGFRISASPHIYSHGLSCIKVEGGVLQYAMHRR